KLAGITSQTPDPPGGVIYRKPGSQEPTGVLRDNAMGLVDRLIPAASEEEILEGVRAALAEAARNGVTSVQDMDGSDAATRRELFRIPQHLAGPGNVAWGIVLRGRLGVGKGGAQRGGGGGLGDAGGKMGGARAFGDGSLAPSPAKMYEPFLNEPGSTG